MGHVLFGATLVDELQPRNTSALLCVSQASLQGALLSGYVLSKASRSAPVAALLLAGGMLDALIEPAGDDEQAATQRMQVSV